VKVSLRLGVMLVALAAVSTLCAADSEPPTITITAPEEGLTITSGSIQVTASYVASGETLVQLVELLVDGARLEARAIEPSQPKGTASFTWLPRGYQEGEHRLAVRATDSEGNVAEAAIAVRLERRLLGPDKGVRILSPEQGATISGKTTVHVAADEPSAVRYVIFLVDDVFKAMSNVRPFSYVWDTTRYLNGLHQLKAKAYLAGGREAITPVIQVRVDNPQPAAMRPIPKVRSEAVVRGAPSEPPARTGEPALPPPMHTESASVVQPVLTVSEPEVGAPGTAPFVHTTGELIRPLRASSRALQPRAEPVQLALPSATGSEAEREAASIPPPTSPPVRSPSEPPLAMAGTNETLAPEGREPAHAPIEVALNRPAESTPMPARDAKTAASPTWEGAPAMDAEAMGGSGAAPSGIQIAMLPPEPTERLPAPKLTAHPAPADIIYVVQKGDWLRGIAAQYGLPAEEIARANNIANPDLLTPGQKLVIPSTPIYFDNRPVRAEVPTFIAKGRAIVPFRPVIEEAGGTVAWEGAAQRASAAARGHTIAITIDSSQAEVDGRYVTMCAPAALLCGRTLVPVRFLGDALDLMLQYQDGILHIASMR